MCIITGSHSHSDKELVCEVAAAAAAAVKGSVSIGHHCEAPMTGSAVSAGEGPVWRISASRRQHHDLAARCGPQWSECHEAWHLLRDPAKVSSAWMPCVTHVLKSLEMRMGASPYQALCCWPCPQVISRYAWSMVECSCKACYFALLSVMHCCQVDTVADP